MAYLDGIEEKRQAIQKRQTEQQDLGAMLGELKKMQLAAMMGQSKPSVVLTDQTDLGDKMQQFGDKLAAAISGLDSTDTDKRKLEALTTLKDALDSLSEANTEGLDGVASVLTRLESAIQALDMSPNITIPAPNVTVESASIDLEPLQDTLKQFFTPPEDDKVDLECYRAQDIRNSGDIQYVGFVNPSGNWYIIENDVKGNSLRYVFGRKGYKTAFKRAASYQYSLLNEAIDALSA